ncbi:MAG: type 1 glutamine amidotransferase domain-containing protein [Bacteroidota bacterium]|nr:type 1 glutamine amidotransferase domain-containing protein [Bacteroidota bacterium]MDP4233609.1 type 1 glutamine amidotransferase domain-containing protein [Bacteroidota bacterium]MDP4243131.1 type 1 glutamine amidotransferase domain-containing protein [Bacteroidota bacterium]MDP4288537.1 type 1 glutamine amidotransferase domain-containing protein [Bacteroidota bacterium]
MAQSDLTGMSVAIIVTDNFEESELTGPREALDNAGADTFLIAPKPEWVRGFRHDQAGDDFPVDQTLDEANPDEFDALLLPGGALNADRLRTEKRALEFVRRMNQEGKPIAFICHAPWVLISAGLVKDRRLTGFHTIKDDIINAGGKYEDTEVIRDRNWVSSRQPSDIHAFNEAMLELFSERVPAHA